MKVLLSQKIRIYPNSFMKSYFEECFGYSRYCYNKGLDLWNKLYDEGQKPNFRKVRDIYKRELKEDWESNYSPIILDNALNGLNEGFNLFYKKIAKHPKFKSKRNSKQSFTFNRKNDSTIRIINKHLYLPKMKYGIKMSENIKLNGIIKLCTVSKHANRYFASFTIEIDDNDLFKNDLNNYIGIDANIGHFDISEENHRYPFPLKELQKYYDKISFYQKMLSKKQKGSNKYNVVKTKLQNIYFRINNIQNDWLHKFTTFIVTSYKNICIEDLNIKGMIKNRKLSKVIIRSLFYRFKIFIEYKSKLYSNSLVIADRYFPSTQMCSNCGYTKSNKTNDKMKLSDRIYICPKCGLKINRDYNSTLNLKNYMLNFIG